MEHLDYVRAPQFGADDFGGTLCGIVKVSEGLSALANLGSDVPLFVESLRELPAEYPAQLEGEEPGSLVMPS